MTNFRFDFSEKSFVLLATAACRPLYTLDTKEGQHLPVRDFATRHQWQAAPQRLPTTTRLFWGGSGGLHFSPAVTTLSLFSLFLSSG
jgi:hypothetical protein